MTSISIQLNEQCNMHCSFCCRVLKNYSTNTQSIINTLQSYVDTNGNPSVVIFTGGEPLLCLSELKQIVASGISSKIAITTNGLLLTKDIITWINKNNIHVILSLQGITGEKSLEYAVENSILKSDWISAVQSIHKKSISYVVTDLSFVDNLLSLYNKLHISIGLSLDITSTIKENFLFLFEQQLRYLYSLDQTSVKWLKFLHITKKCDYSDISILPNGELEPICNKIPDFSGCVNLLKIMSKKDYYYFIALVDKFMTNSLSNKITIDVTPQYDTASYYQTLLASMSTQINTIQYNISGLTSLSLFKDIIEVHKITKPNIRISLCNVHPLLLSDSFVNFINYHDILVEFEILSLNGEIKSVKSLVIESKNLNLVKQIKNIKNKYLLFPVIDLDSFSNPLLEVSTVFSCPIHLSLHDPILNPTALIILEKELKLLCKFNKYDILFDNRIENITDPGYLQLLDICSRYKKGLL